MLGDPAELRATLTAIFTEVSAACDGARLVTAALGNVPARPVGREHVLALGKAAPAMVEGLLRALPADRLGQGLLIVREGAALPPLPPGWHLQPGNHPIPDAASLRAGAAARAFVAGLPPGEPLLVLLSGGGSALACLPVPGVSFEDKRAALRAIADAGAPIAALNTVRKHLSAIKGGQLGALARGPVRVLLLSDVLGDDPAVIASGPFAPDPSRFAEALAILNAYAPQAPAAVRTHLEAGAAGARAETPKAGDLPAIAHEVLAGPSRVFASAERAAAARGFARAALEVDTTAEVAALAERVIAEAHALTQAAIATLAVGNGEPVIDLAGVPAAVRGRGGRASHLALLVARGIAGLPDVAFLAAGTDDRDGSSDAAGAVVDGGTWPTALARGLDPAGALARFDSAGLLAGLGALVPGAGRSNLLDLHLLAALGRKSRTEPARR